MKKETKSVEAAADPAIIVFGLDDSQRPHASWFAEPDASLAEKAAGLMGMRVLRVTTPEHRAAALQLATGRVFASGKAFTPFCATGLYDRLMELGGSFQPVPAAAPNEPMPDVANIPSSWADIGLGSLVLACDPAEGAWFEAIVVEHNNQDLLGLRWQQWPELPPFVRRSEHVALVSAAAHKALAEMADQSPAA